MARKSLFWCNKFGRWVCPFVVTYEVIVSGIQMEFPVHLKKIWTDRGRDGVQRLPQ
jgi:hypothetical protein